MSWKIHVSGKLSAVIKDYETEIDETSPPDYTDFQNLLNSYKVCEPTLKPDGSKTFDCIKKCGRSYKYKRNLWRHLTSECGVGPQYQCNICTQWFVHRSSLKKHLYYFHSILLDNKNKK